MGHRFTPTGKLADLFTTNHTRNQGLVHKRGRSRATSSPIDPVDMPVGSRVKFLGDRRWWTVAATDGERVVLTRTGDFGRPPVYTVIVWSQGRRGPHNSWGYPALTREDCERIVKGMAVDSGYPRLDLSERGAVFLDLEAVVYDA